MVDMSAYNPVNIDHLIRQRRAVYPVQYSDRPVDLAIIEQVLENANWAPNHKRTEPWRFKVFRGDARIRLADYLADWYRDHTTDADFSEKKHRKTYSKPLQSDTVIAICMQRDPQERLPFWEEVAAVACAVQNMWLTCTAYGIGCYWSSPKSILQAQDFLDLAAGEHCLGLFYMGWPQGDWPVGRRDDWRDKVVWMD